MYLRFTQRANADGSVVRYVAVAHNHRVGGKIKPDVLINLGRVDQLDVEGLRRLAASIRKYFGDGTDVVDTGVKPMEVIDVRSIGTTWLLDGLWQQLGMGPAVRLAADARRLTPYLERVLFALVASRAVGPTGTLSTAEWVSRDVVVPRLSTMRDDQAHRAMDLLVDADTRGAVQQAAFSAVAGALELEVDLLFFDTVSTDHTVDTAGPRTVIGLAVTREGIPVRAWCWPGDPSDAAVLAEVRADARGWKLGRLVTVADRGSTAAEVLAGRYHIAGMRMRDGHPLVGAAQAERGRYQRVRDNLRVKEVQLEPGVRYIVCHRLDHAVHDRQDRDDAIARIEAELDRLRTWQRTDAARRRAERALRDHPTLGRWIRRHADGHLSIDTAKVRADQRLDGKYLIATADPHISAEDAALGYTNLLEAERGFRDMQSTLSGGHRLEHRIRAYVLVCWLALLLTRVAERGTGQPWCAINRDLYRLHQVTLAGPAGTVVQTTPPRAEQAAIYGALGVPPPKRITAFDPA